MFKNILVSGVKQIVEQQWNKRGGDSGGQSSSSQPPPSNMSGYGGYGGYQPQSGYPNQGGYPSQPPNSGAGPYPMEHQYSMPDQTPQSGYGGYGGYQPPSGYPPVNPPQSGYAPQGGYPPPTPQSFPGQPSQPSYPTELPYSMPGENPTSSGYGGYPTQSGFGGYPPQPPQYQSSQSNQIGFVVPSHTSSSPCPSSSSEPYPSGPSSSPYPPSSASYPAAPYSSGGYPTGGNSAYPSAPPATTSYGGNSYGGTIYPSSGGYTAPSYGVGQGPSSSTMWGNPSVKPYPAFHATADAETLRKAMKGLGCNNSKVIQVLCARSNAQRQEIARAFKTMYGKDLLSDLKSELHGDFEDVILALMQRPAVYDAMQLRKAMAGLGTKESVLIEIMTTRTNAQIGELRMVYMQMYGRDLERDLIGETSGHFKRLLVSLCAGGRDESMHVDAVRANHDARRLYQAGEGRLGTDESAFNAILAAQNYAQLRVVFDEYQKMRGGRTIEQAVHSEFSGDIRDGLLAICAVVRSKAAYFAKLLYDSMRGLGTRDTDLIRVVVTRCEVDMADIRMAFEQIYKNSLENMIRGDCSGSYKEALIALVRGN